MNLNRNQIIAIVLVVLGVLAASAAQLTDLFGAKIAHTIISSSSLLMSILSGVLAVLTGQSGILKDVQAMPGVDKVVVNKDANSTLAAAAVNPNSKVEAAPGAEAAVAQIARAAT